VKQRSLIVASLALLTFFTVARAGEPSLPELVDQLQAAVTKEVKQAQGRQGNGAPASPYGDGMRLTAWAAQVKTMLNRALTQGDFNTLQETLSQIQAMAPGDEVAKLCEAIGAKAQAEQTARLQAYMSSVNAQVAEAVKAAFAAKEPKELDTYIIGLSQKDSAPDYRVGEAGRNSAEKAQAAVSFLCHWQDYLQQMKSGNVDAGARVLRELANDTSRYPFVPRSEILGRINGSPNDNGDGSPVQPAVPSVQGKTLADVDALIIQTRELLSRNRNAQDLQQFLQKLDALAQAREAARSGLLGQAFGYCTNRDLMMNGQDYLLPLRQELLAQILPDYVGVAKTYPMGKDETAPDYLLRITKEARTKGDWMTAWKAMDTYRAVAYANGSGQPAWLSGEIQGLSQFIVAQNLEAAGQYVDAIRAYKRVLSQQGEDLPIKETTDRLAALKKEHPDDFDAASKPAEIVRPVPMNPNLYR